MRHLLLACLCLLSVSAFAQRLLLVGPTPGTNIVFKRYFDPRNGDVASDGQFVQVATASMFYPWVGLLLGAGTITEAEGETNHPWIAKVSCAAASGTGARFALGTISEQLDVGKQFTAILKVQNVPDTQGRYGWLDNYATTASADSAYIWQTNGVLYGYTSSNNVFSITATGLTYPATSWLRMQTHIESDTVVRYSVFSGGGTLLWTDTTTNNIPLGPGRSVGMGTVTWTTGSTAQELILLDYLERLNPPLIR